MRRELLLSKTIEGFLLHKSAEGRSRHTLADYRNCLGKLLAYLGDIPLRQVDVKALRRFFAYLNTDYRTTPDGIAPRPEQRLSQKTIRNIHAACSSLFSWAVDEELAATNPLERIQRPRNQPPPIEPLTEREVKALLTVCAETRAWRDRPEITAARYTAARDRAIILVLLDTGIRASELCRLTVGDVDRITGHIEILKGKGRKSRTVRAERRTMRAIWRYLATREHDVPDDAPLFAAKRINGYYQDHPLSRHALLRLVKRLGKRAGVRGVTVHRFRHTFAIEYLRNGGDIYTLQFLLGHSSLDMVRRYLLIVQADIDTQHQSASPVANWRL